MRTVWSEVHKRQLMRRIWVALAAVQHDKDKTWIDRLDQFALQVDVERSRELEKETHHDVVAELLAFEETLDPRDAKLLHRAITSSDIVDNADAIRTNEAVELIQVGLCAFATSMADMIRLHAGTPCMGYTHLQPASTTTVGYRLAQYGQDLLTDLEQMFFVRTSLRCKGIKGVVGSYSSLEELHADHDEYPTPAATEYLVMQVLHQACWDVSTQVYPRKQDYLVISWLASVAQTLSRFALDVRLMQSPLSGIWTKKSDRGAIASSAMPYKDNPIKAEKICSLARHVASMVRTAWENAANSALERTLDDSANRRMILPEAFLAVDEMLQTAIELVRGSEIDRDLAKSRVRLYSSFINLQRVQTELVARGHGQHLVRLLLKGVSRNMRYSTLYGNRNPSFLRDLVIHDDDLTQLATPDELKDWITQDTTEHLKLAMLRSIRIAERLRGATRLYERGD